MLKKEDIMHIASLARIGLREDEIEKYQRELSLILDYFKKLEKADTEGVEPIGHITGVDNILREDSVFEREEDVKKLIFDNFPDTINNKVKVKSILT
jgi:aspartyl-tRNA(Asn)/glutamyl-tRNA(Gln) amidotransferase subunit C